VAGPTVAIQSSTAQTTTFFAPGGTTDLKFTLQVFANELASAPATLNVHVEGDKAVPTVTVANAAISADEKTVVKLEATGTPGTDGDTLKFTWEQRGGDTVQLADASSPTATFTAPDVTGEKSFVFAVTATDSQGLSSAPAIVVVDVKDLDTTRASGCGCTSGTSGLVPFAMLFAMAWFRRRKQA
ncbi:MAG: PKD domain-containing protein, partial [Myxococcaceae bacterium]